MTAPERKISLAAWSLHRAFFAQEIDQLGMIDACADLGLHGFEMVNVFFPAPTHGYLKRLRQHARDRDVQLLLIMCDDEGSMAAPERDRRMKAARNHHKWIDIAADVGCQAIRCNTGARPGDADALERCAESFSALLEYADPAGIDVLLENHWGLSSDPAWLMALIARVDHPRFGTLPDFGNFPPDVDRYEAVRMMMTRARAVSAKCYDFDDDGNEKSIDFARMMRIVDEAGYAGWIGIEYEGERLSEREGILACKRLIERL